VLKLFSGLVGQEKLPEPTILKFKPIDNVLTRFHDQVYNHFISGHTVTSNEVPNLLVPVKVDLIGKNGLDVFVQSIDMTAQPTQIINEISTFLVLKETYKENNLKCQNFVLTQEPSQKLRKQHCLWAQLRNSSQFNYVDISESDRIIEYAETNDVRPVFGDIDNTKGLDHHDSPF
jgi:hypothetical protein